MPLPSLQTPMTQEGLSPLPACLLQRGKSVTLPSDITAHRLRGSGDGWGGSEPYWHCHAPSRSQPPPPREPRCCPGDHRRGRTVGKGKYRRAARRRVGTSSTFSSVAPALLRRGSSASSWGKGVGVGIYGVKLSLKSTLSRLIHHTPHRAQGSPLDPSRVPPATAGLAALFTP